jgi:hypothetical protein
MQGNGISVFSLWFLVLLQKITEFQIIFNLGQGNIILQFGAGRTMIKNVILFLNIVDTL